MKSATVIILGLLVLASCVQPQQQNSGNEATPTVPESYHIDLTVIPDSQQCNLSEVATDVHYIPLETTRQSLLQRIDGVWKMNDYLLVSDFDRLLLFSSSGKFIRQISQKGNGPKDYIYVNGVIPDEANNEFYLITSNRIAKYSIEGEYLRSMPTSEWFTVAIQDTNRTIVAAPVCEFRLKSDTTKQSALVVYDSLGLKLKQIPVPAPLYREPHQIRVMASNHTLYRHGETLRYFRFQSDTLYTVNDTSLVPYLSITLGDNKYGLKELLDVKPQELGALRTKDIKKWAIRKIVEDGGAFYVTTESPSRNTSNFTLWINKSNGAIHRLGAQGFMNDLDGGPAFFPKKEIYSETMMSWMNASELTESVLGGNVTEKQSRFGERHESAKRLAHLLKEDDNPVLMIVTMKNK